MGDSPHCRTRNPGGGVGSRSNWNAKFNFSSLCVSCGLYFLRNEMVTSYSVQPNIEIKNKKRSASPLCYFVLFVTV